MQVVSTVYAVCCMLHRARMHGIVHVASCTVRVARYMLCVVMCTLHVACCKVCVARCVAHCPRLVSRALPKISVESAIVPAAIIAATKMIQRNKHTCDTTYRRLVPTAIILPQNSQTIQWQSLQHCGVRFLFPAVSEPTLFCAVLVTYSALQAQCNDADGS